MEIVRKTSRRFKLYTQLYKVRTTKRMEDSNRTHSCTRYYKTHGRFKLYTQLYMVLQNTWKIQTVHTVVQGTSRPQCLKPRRVSGSKQIRLATNESLNLHEPHSVLNL